VFEFRIVSRNKYYIMFFKVANSGNLGRNSAAGSSARGSGQSSSSSSRGASSSAASGASSSSAASSSASSGGKGQAAKHASYAQPLQEVRARPQNMHHMNFHSEFQNSRIHSEFPAPNRLEIELEFRIR
jgi:hypothetical protein